MDHKVFENWFFNTLIPSIPPASTIVMDNTPYHSRKKDKAPTSSSTKATMKKWLQDQNIPIPTDLRKSELYQLVKLHKPPMPTYEIGSKAVSYTHLDVYKRQVEVREVGLRPLLVFQSKIMVTTMRKWTIKFL